MPHTNTATLPSEQAETLGRLGEVQTQLEGALESLAKPPRIPLTDDGSTLPGHYHAAGTANSIRAALDSLEKLRCLAEEGRVR
jgi:hypothetical protein